MKIKINNDEMRGLILVYGELVTKYRKISTETKDPETMLYLAIFETMYIKLLQKSILWQPRYSLNLSPVEALALWIEFNGIMDETTQMGNMMQRLCNKIHQQIIANASS